MQTLTQKSKTKQKNSRAIISISDKVDFKEEIITRDIEEYFTRINTLIYQKDIVILKMYVLNNIALKCVRQKLT